MNHGSDFESILTAREKRDLSNEVFRERDFVGVDLSGADLRGARFERVSLHACTLAGADLRGAHFIMCDLSQVLLGDAKLGDNRFYGTTLREVAGISDDARLTIVREGGVFLHPSSSSR
jgi:uncharacterized protein YjbI with pentapeptide repeats